MHMRRAASQRVSRRRFLGISAAGVAAGAAGLGVRQGASAQDDGDVIRISRAELAEVNVRRAAEKALNILQHAQQQAQACLSYTSPSPRDS